MEGYLTSQAEVALVRKLVREKKEIYISFFLSPRTACRHSTRRTTVRMMDPVHVRHIVDASAQNVLPLRPMMGSYVWLGMYHNKHKYY